MGALESCGRPAVSLDHIFYPHTLVDDFFLMQRVRAMKMSMDEPMSRSEAISTALATAGAAVAAASMPSVAFADGARSSATQSRARGIYGTRIEGLKSSVDKGDTAAVLAEKNAFILFNSGVYSTDKAKFATADGLAKDVIKAAESGDASGLKSAYAAYLKYIVVKSGYKAEDEGQGLGSEFDYKRG